MEEDKWIETAIKNVIGSGASIETRLQIIEELIELYKAMKEI